ncbi:MAG: hypothetical protein DYG89_12325 [Caldilinea sp. CFX5]|nr:hypothetical protein [Caldilinea sp. CFX5]
MKQRYLHRLSKAPATITIILTLSAFVVRMMAIGLFPDGGSDLRIYHYFGERTLLGLNPYRAPLDGPISPYYADMPPLNLLIFAAVLMLHNAPLTLRFFFAVVDTVIVFLLAMGGKRQGLAFFYALNPLVLFSFVIIAEDKVVIWLFVALLFLLLEQGRATSAVVTTVLLTCYKIMGLFFFVPLVAHLGRRKQDYMLWVGLFGFLLLITHLPYFPDNLLAYSYREARTRIDPPIHASPTMFLAALGIYTPTLVKVWITGTLLMIYALYFWNRLSIQATVALSIFTAYIIAPEISFPRVLLITLPFFFLVALTAKEWLLLWVLTTISSFVIYWQVYGFPADFLKSSFGDYGSLRHVLLVNAFPGLLLFFAAKQALLRKAPPNNNFYRYRR